MNTNSQGKSKYQSIFEKYSTQQLILRELEHEDYNKGYYELLASFFKAPKVEEDEFKKQLDLIKNESAPHVIVGKNKEFDETLVIEDIEKKIVIASGTVLMERKFIRANAIAAHIEEIVVHQDYRKNGCGKMLIESLKDIAVYEKSYKIILDCQDVVLPFYEKVGFSKNGIAMKIYVDADPKKEASTTNSKL